MSATTTIDRNTVLAAAEKALQAEFTNDSVFKVAKALGNAGGFTSEQIQDFINTFKPKTAETESPVADAAEPAYQDFHNYVAVLGRAGDTMCFQAIVNSTGETETEFVPYEKAITREYYDELKRSNEGGASIYVAMNTYPKELIGSRVGRTQENVVAVRAMQSDVDRNGQATIGAIKSSASVPLPSIVVESSPGKFQGIWLVDGISKDEAKPLMQAIAAEFGTDKAVAEIARVMRVPGFVNCKYESAPVARTLAQTNARYRREDFKVHVTSTTETKPTKSHDWYKDVVFQHKQIYTQMLEMVGWYIRVKNIKDPDVLYSIVQPYCDNAVDIDGRTPYHCDMDKVRADIDKWCKDPKFETGDEYKARTQLTISNPTQAPTASAPQQTQQPAAFKHSKVSGSPHDFVVKPMLGQKEGWFPLGSVSLIGGSSGSNKTTWALDLLYEQAHQRKVWGHDVVGRPYLVFMFDRGEGAHARTMERLGYGLDEIPVRFLPPVTDGLAVTAILDHLEAEPVMPGVVFIEGADMLVEDGNKGQFVVPFMSALQKVAQHYHIAVVLSVGAPKMRVGEGYTAKRDSMLGSEKWSRMSDTVVAMQFVDGDDVDSRRACFVLLRNGPAERFNLILVNGKLALDESPRPQKSTQFTRARDKAEEAKHWYTQLFAAATSNSDGNKAVTSEEHRKALIGVDLSERMRERAMDFLGIRYDRQRQMYTMMHNSAPANSVDLDEGQTSAELTAQMRRAEVMFDEGKTSRQVADALGVSQTKAARWRKTWNGASVAVAF